MISRRGSDDLGSLQLPLPRPVRRAPGSPGIAGAPRSRRRRPAMFLRSEQRIVVRAPRRPAERPPFCLSEVYLYQRP